MSHQSNHTLVKVFFALWPTATEANHLSAWQLTLKQLCGGRVMRAGTLHTTLVFIGDIEQSRLDALQLAAQELSAACFKLCFDEARYWEHNHIMYAASGQLPQQLTQLVGALEQSLIRHCFKFEQRVYKPHVTLLRNAHRIDPLPALPSVCWQVNDFALVQSVHQDGLATYRVLARFPLLPCSG